MRTILRRKNVLVADGATVCLGTREVLDLDPVPPVDLENAALGGAELGALRAYRSSTMWIPAARRRRLMPYEIPGKSVSPSARSGGGELGARDDGESIGFVATCGDVGDQTVRGDADRTGDRADALGDRGFDPPTLRATSSGARSLA